MQYLFLLYANEGGWAELTPEQRQQGIAAYAAYTETLRKEGILAGSNRLQPIDAATTFSSVMSLPRSSSTTRPV